MSRLSKRRSPIEHKVKKHSRQGKTIDTYKRGKGKKPKGSQRTKKRRVVGSIPTFKGYSLKITYPDGKTENIHSSSKTMASAIDDGLSQRRQVRDIKSINIRGVK